MLPERLFANLKDNVVGLASITLVGGLVGRLFRYGINYVIAIQYGAAALGVFTVGLVVLQAGSTFSRFGTVKTAEKYVSIFSDRGDAQSVAGTVAFALAAPTVLGVAIVALVPTISDLLWFSDRITTGDVAFLFALGIPLFSVMRVGMGITRGLKETKYSVYIYDIGHSGSGVLLIAVLGTFAPRPRSAAIAYLTAVLVGVVLTGWYLVRLGVFDHLRRATVHTREFLSYSPSVFLIIAVQYLLSWTDVVVLSVYSTQEQIGYYQIAFQTSILVLLVLKALNSIFPSVAAELYDSGHIDALETLYVASTKWASFVTIQLAAFVVLASESILTLFGAGFSSANLALLFLVVGQSVTALSGPAGNLLSMTSNERIETVNTVSVALLNLGLNLLLVREYGITGAAAATGVSLALLNVIRVFEVRYFLGFTPFQPRFVQIPILLGVTWLLGSEAKTLVTGALPTVVTTGVVAGGVTLVGVYLLYDEDNDQSLITTVS